MSKSAGNLSADASSSDSEVTNIHLKVICHGLWGSPSNTAFLARALAQAQNGSLSPAAAKSTSTSSISDDAEILVDDLAGAPAASGTKDDGNKSKKSEKKRRKEAEAKRQEEEHVKALLEEVQIAPAKADRPGYRLVILNTKSNNETFTYDGIDLCAERVLREIKAEIKRLHEDPTKAELGPGKKRCEVKRFSILGYSLGGLISRYVVGLMWQRGFFVGSPTPPSSSSATPDAALSPSTSSSSSENASRQPLNVKLESVNFYTFATPHLGIPPSNSSFGRLANYIGGRVLSRTGRQLYTLDHEWVMEEERQGKGTTGHLSVGGSQKKGEVKRGLLEMMALPDSVFMTALENFKHVIIYANGVNDITVPFRSGAFELDDPFLLEGTKIDMGEKYPHLIASYEPQREIPPDERTTTQKLRGAVLPKSVPFLLNPRRYPFRFPLNYLAVISLPIVLPLFIGIFLVRSRGQASASAKRIKEEELRWLEEQEDDTHASETGRIQRMLTMAGAVAQNVAEDNVAFQPDRNAGRADAPHTHANGTTKPVASDPAAAMDGTKLIGSPLSEHERYPGSKLSPLLEEQKRMAVHLNTLPNVVKRFAHLDVVNSHAVIICRTPSMSMHQQGLDIVRHFAETFQI